MKFKKVMPMVGGLLVLASLLFLMNFASRSDLTSPKEQQQNKEALSSDLASKELLSKKEQTLGGHAKKILAPPAAAKGKKKYDLAQLEALFSAFRKQDFLNGSALQTLQEKAVLELERDVEGYEHFLWKKLLDKESLVGLEAALFFTDIYTSHALNPVNFAEKVLQTPDWGENSSSLKAFMVDSLLVREQSGKDFSSNPLPIIEKALLNFVLSSADTNLIHDSLLQLKDHYSYEQPRLEELARGGSPETQSFLKALF